MLENNIRKVTVELPADLLENAQHSTGKNLKDTIAMGLERLTREKAYDDLLALQGQCQFSLDMHTLREDREMP